MLIEKILVYVVGFIIKTISKKRAIIDKKSSGCKKVVNIFF